jgi:hypothetical protein
MLVHSLSLNALVSLLIVMAITHLPLTHRRLLMRLSLQHLTQYLLSEAVYLNVDLICISHYVKKSRQKKT